MANWFSDTWREITSGGKAKTETYNGRKSEPRRAEPARKAEPRRSSSFSTTPARGATTPQRSSGGGGGGGRVSAAAARTPVRLEREARPSGNRSGRGGEFGRAPGRRLNSSEAAQQQAQIARYRVDPELTGAEAAAQQQQMVGRAAMSRLDPELQVLPEDGPVMERPERRAETEAAGTAVGPAPWSGRDRIRAAGREPGGPVRTNVRELSDEEYLALTPRQRAAVQYNTALVDAAGRDRSEGTGTQQARDFLTSLDLAPEGELDAFLRLDRAVGDGVLRRLDDPTARSQSAEARRWARGTPGAAPDAEEFAYARSAADATASALASAMGRGFTGLTGQGSGSVAEALAGGAVAERAGFGSTPRDLVIQRAFDVMIGSDANYTPEQVANGIANMNDEAGTDVDPQEVWDFAKLRLDAADMANLAGENFVLPVTDATIVPLSVADIRTRYGI